MLGFLFLLFSFTVGWMICSYAFPNLTEEAETTYNKNKISFSPILLYLPAWYLIGTLAMTWATYLIAFLFREAKFPLIIANSIVMTVALVFSLAALSRKLFHKTKKLTLLTKDKNAIKLEILLVTAVTILACILMWRTLIVIGDRLYIGVSVFSDFSPHIGMIRSFSYGNNFPSSYPHFAGEDMKYHFLFQFLVGNLEYLGLRIDYAFNLPSIFSFISAFLLLYLLTVKITNRLGAGLLACLFFAFRSSKALFTYLAGLPAGTNILQALMENTEFIGDTPNENWGLWNLNVYCNQRHLAFGMAVIFLVILMFLPHLYEMFEELDLLRSNTIREDGNNGRNGGRKKFNRILQEIFFTKEGWKVKDIKLSIATGVMLGSLGFFHGAAVIACLVVLFITAILSRRRLELLIMAVITVIITLLQTYFFIHGSAVSPKFLFGFIAEQKTLFGVLDYLLRLLGILPIVLLTALSLEKSIRRYLILAFFTPLLLAFTISLTVDVTVNHKYIMISCILLGIFAASLVVKLFEKGYFIPRMAAVFLTVLLTATGIYDFRTVLKKNVLERAIVLELNHPLTEWVDEHSNSKDIFLTSNYTINQLTFGGAMLYQGWQYYAWSAGYDTDYRDLQVKLMYEADTSEELDALVQENRIRYIVVDQDNRNSEYYIVNEANIRNTYQCVYSEGQGDLRLSIYDTGKPMKP